MRKFFALLLLLPFLCFGNSSNHPFNYDLQLTSIPGKNGRTMVCFHGYGGNFKIAHMIKNVGIVDATLISFNFPDYDILKRGYDHRQATFGTVEELLPALYVLKKSVVEGGLESIDLYGFSAGGGVAINLIAVLNTSAYDARLQQIGIGDQEKKWLLAAIQKGVVILDTPLKSVEEMMALRGVTPDMQFIAKNYEENGFRPIDSLERLSGLSLDVILHFQEVDEILFNRDDAIFIERLKKANSRGSTAVVIDNDGGHNAIHLSLWRHYSQKIQGDQAMNYVKESQGKKYFIGIPVRTANESFHQDAVPLWTRFFREDLAEKIPNKMNRDLLGVYTDYEGDYTMPFTYLIGCEVIDLKTIPEGMVGLEIGASCYAVFKATGAFPESMLHAWQTIWSSDLKRSYTTDFEVYDAHFNPQNNPEVKIYIAV